MSSTKHNLENHPPVPTPHFGRVKRKANAWKTQHVAAAKQHSVGDSIDATTSSMNSPGNTNATVNTQEYVAISTDAIDRVDLSHTETVLPHFLPNEKKSKTWESNVGSFLVPLGDDTMRPPAKAVPDADSFRQDISEVFTGDKLEFRPNWEVEQFLWPEVTTELLYQHEQLFSEFANLIDESILVKQKRLVITGVRRGEGRTTLSIAIARKLSNDGKRILIVDADLVSPKLADSMGIDTQISWLTDQAVFESSAELLIGNAESNVCIMPLMQSSRAEFSAHAYQILDVSLRKLEQFFDVIILEFGPIAQIDLAMFRNLKIANAGLFVHDPLVSDVKQYADAFQKFQALEMSHFGFVENGAVRSLQSVV